MTFVLPIVQALSGRMVPRVRAMAVLPTQDLAIQVYKVINCLVR
jgi:ATP-dependent RNA helicase DDX51/DBP6